MKTLRSRALPLLAVVLAACSDTVAPDGAAPEPAPGTPRPLATITCTATVRTGAVSCGAPAEGPRSVLIGGQNQYVRLTSSDIAVTADTFAFDVTVTNLLPQPLNTTDFTNTDPSGLRVFFVSGPTAVGPGTVTLANAHGTGTFTAGGQPYIGYYEYLPPGATSAPKRWQLQFSPEVTAFTFQVAVAAAVPYPDGYVHGEPSVLTLDPGETRAISGIVYSFVGNPLAGQPLAYASSDPALVTVSGNQVTAGTTQGLADVYVTSGIRPSARSTAVSVCQSAVVGDGHVSVRSLTATDCFAAFATIDNRPLNFWYGDLYRVSLTAGQTVTLTLTSSHSLDTFLTLVDPAGAVVAENDDAGGAIGLGSQVVYTAPTSGVYVFEASTHYPLDTGNYTLSVSIS